LNSASEPEGGERRAESGRNRFRIMPARSVLHAVSSAAIVLAAGVLLYLSLRGIQWKSVVHTVASIRPAYAALALVIGIVPMLLRAARWRILLQANAPVSFKTAFWAVAAGYFGNNFLPARGGEVVRSYIVRERSQLGGSYIMATALSERVADAVALAVIGAIVLFFMPRASAWMTVVRGSFALIGVVGVSVLVGLPMLEKPISRMLRPWSRIQLIMQQFVLGVRSLHNLPRLLGFAALTAVIWWLDAAATSTLAHALSISMPISVAMLLIIALSLSSALPSTPGYVGVFQFVAVKVLPPFGISSSAAIAFIFVTQAFSYLVTGTLGVLAMTYFTPFNWRVFRRPLQPIQIQS
jgi:uncharacterized protein (TIRG00374 family)